MAKELIIYFSLSGTTKKAALNLQKKLNADIYQLQAEKPYPSDYDGIVAVAQNEKDKQVHPELKKPLPDLTRYDKVYVGYPTWWSQPPMIIHSLFDQVNFTGKKVMAFATSASTPLTDTLDTFSDLAENAGAILFEK